MAEGSILQLRIQLNEVHPPVWRRILVPITIRYDQLNVIIQLAFGWTNSHLHGFVVAHDRQIEYIPEGSEDMAFGKPLLTKNYLLYPDIKKGSVTYTYDFGADWEHKIKLEKILSIDEIPSAKLPYCIGGRGANRVENSRGMDASMNGASDLAFDKDSLNELLEEYAVAGEMMLRFD